MPRLPAAFGVMLTAAVCIGLAAFRYPQVNQQVWKMVQAGRQQSEDGKAGVLRLGLALPAEVTVARSQQNHVGQVPILDQEMTFSANTRHDAVTFAGLPVAEYVGADHSDWRGGDETAGTRKPRLSQEEAIQITLAVPPQMAILGQREGGDPADDAKADDSENAKDDGKKKSEKLGHQGMVSGGLFSGQSGTDSSACGYEEPMGDDVPETRSSRLDSQPGSVPPTTFEAGSEEGGASECNTTAGSHLRDDFVDPPLVPIVRTESPESTSEGTARASDFEMVAPHEAVARRAPSPPVVLSSDLPLVDVHRSPWFRVERPQRLPPVEKESQGGEGSSGPQGLWDWTPSIPLYPSTGR